MNTTTLPFDTNKVIEICRRNDVAMLGVFGSVARGEATEQSDVDLLVRFSKQKSLWGRQIWPFKLRPLSAKEWICLPKLRSVLTFVIRSNAN